MTPIQWTVLVSLLRTLPLLAVGFYALVLAYRHPTP